MHEFPHRHSDLSGCLLAASPELSDPNFARSLVFIAEHNEGGAVGMVVNRPLAVTLGEMAEASASAAGLGAVPVYQGGPVRSGQLLMALFGLNPSTGRLTCRLDVPPEELAACLGRPRCWVKAYLGYAGWGEGQLEREMEERAWTSFPADETLLDDRLLPGLWSTLQSKDQRWRPLYRHLPRDVGLN